MAIQTGDTIAAVSSPVGPAPRGIVRLSGLDAVRIADALFCASDGAPLGGRRGYTRWPGMVSLTADGARVPAEAYLFRAPRSFTRQDMVELHTPGGAAVLSLVLDQSLALGARQAEPGEFAMRAFLAGAIDLAEAEGIAAVISATSDGQLRAAGRLARGALSARTAALLDRIADLLALVEADIDFADEPVDFISPAQVRATIQEIMTSLSDLQTRSAEAETLETLPRIVLTGPPNAGKSTLMNRLTGLDRAICSPLPGTTRDVLTAPLQLERHEAILVDGAGCDAADDEIAGRARHLLQQEITSADLVCVVLDASAEPSCRAVPTAWKGVSQDRALVAANKADLLTADAVASRCAALQEATGFDVVPVSALTGAGCDVLTVGMDARLSVAANIVGAEELALTARHRQALDETAAGLGRAEALAASAGETADCAELLALELREACASLGRIAGAVTTEDLLGRVFSRFCIGK